MWKSAESAELVDDVLWAGVDVGLVGCCGVIELDGVGWGVRVRMRIEWLRWWVV